MIKFLIVFCLSFNLMLNAQDKESKKEISLFDKDDKNFDISEYLSQAYGFFPLPTIVTEPAIGAGGGVGLLYLHDGFVGKKGKSGRNIPASISGIIGGGTENGTYLGGAFHMGYYLEDTLRTQTFVGYPSININFYSNLQKAYFMNLKGPIVYQSLKYRLGDSDFFVGLAYLYLSMDSKFEKKYLNTPDIQRNFTTASMAITFDYDSLDNTLSPNKGVSFLSKVSFFDEAFGSQRKFELYGMQGLFYIPISKKIHLEQRIRYDQIVGEDAPFFFYPFIQMRGVPAVKYQGEKNLLYELQLRWSFSSRWDLTVFGGVAKAYGKDKFLPSLIENSFSEADTIYTKGIGFRYMIAKKFGLRVGIDVASSKDDDALYIVFGKAWYGL
jgi:hypothetical protein